MTDANLERRVEQARQAYLLACELELTAFKPGNVSIHSEGHDMTVEDFRQSARVSAPFLTDVSLGLGERIYRAILATRETVGCNTNLGIVLLAAPLLGAFLGPKPTPLRNAVKNLLMGTTIEDAEWVYQAIRCANPAGLGEVAEADVRTHPRITLLQAMKLAADRDSIARQYSNSFAEVFQTAVPLYDSRLSQGADEEWAVVAVYVRLLSMLTDSHIERKWGEACAQQVTARMVELANRLDQAGTADIKLEVLREADREFKSLGINPGTTADLTVATILAAKLQAETDKRERGRDVTSQ